MTGFQLMTGEQQREWADLAERQAHSVTMRFTALDAVHLSEYEALAERLENEYRVESGE